MKSLMSPLLQEILKSEKASEALWKAIHSPDKRFSFRGKKYIVRFVNKKGEELKL